MGENSSPHVCIWKQGGVCLGGGGDCHCTEQHNANAFHSAVRCGGGAPFVELSYTWTCNI